MRKVIKGEFSRMIKIGHGVLLNQDIVRSLLLKMSQELAFPFFIGVGVKKWSYGLSMQMNFTGAVVAPY